MAWKEIRGENITNPFNSGQRLNLEIDRSHLIASTFNSFCHLNPKNLILGIRVHFENERGSDGGGLSAEFYTIVTKELFDPRAGLFIQTPNETSLQINPFSNLVPNHLDLFELCGIILAKVQKNYKFYILDYYSWNSDPSRTKHSPIEIHDG